MSIRIKGKKTHELNLNVVYNFVHLYSFICHLQVVSHGTIAYMLRYVTICIYHSTNSKNFNLIRILRFRDMKSSQIITLPFQFSIKIFMTLNDMTFLDLM